MIVQRALSLWQPWAWAVAAGHKRIENRTWRPKRATKQWIAIHAAKKVDIEAVQKVAEITGEDPELPLGAIVGVAYLDEIVVGASRVDDLDPKDRIWFTGPFGWLFSRAIALQDPIPCRGYQSLWFLEPSIRSRLEGVLPA